jgi:hypothetical protein
MPRTRDRVSSYMASELARYSVTLYQNNMLCLRLRWGFIRFVDLVLRTGMIHGRFVRGSLTMAQ